jgi:hypothetical protein
MASKGVLSPSRTPWARQGPGPSSLGPKAPGVAHPGRRMPDGQTRQRLRTAMSQTGTDNPPPAQAICVYLCESVANTSVGLSPNLVPDPRSQHLLQEGYPAKDQGAGQIRGDGPKEARDEKLHGLGCGQALHG